MPVRTRMTFKVVEAFRSQWGAVRGGAVRPQYRVTGVVYATGATADPIRPASSSSTPPTSMTFEVPRLFRAEALIEVEVVAAVPATG
jgi:2-iminobutanoate/2-iminopropanoate deaminase